MANKKETEKWLKKIGKHSSQFMDVPEELVTEEFCMAAVQVDGYALRYIPEVFKTEALCLAAMWQYSAVLEYVPEALMTYRLNWWKINWIKNKGKEGFKSVPSAQ